MKPMQYTCPNMNGARKPAPVEGSLKGVADKIKGLLAQHETGLC
ncbi:hypothetical protein SAMN06295998_102179 [Primorskyibacter flagellatus]|uniref:Uncharacterized protein n=1 Tax=Primorskyibacter flagellatus TaxID=1387277 RepID=A0A1W1ZV43_9RHOB|nr:hypothetical protein SAMN06295998_102179 [Primorskyibacter flagellatus]